MVIAPNHHAYRLRSSLRASLGRILGRQRVAPFGSETRCLYSIRFLGFRVVSGTSGGWFSKIIARNSSRCWKGRNLWAAGAALNTKKAAKDAQKGVALAKLSRDIIVAAKVGGGDPAANFRLRTAIDKAKAAGLPNSRIENAIEKGAGGGASEEAMEHLTYEGYGPGGVAILIEVATDNRNRTAGDIRSYFNKYEGNLGQDGCVAYLFEEKGIIRCPKSEEKSFEDLLELAIEAGALDVQETDEDLVELITEPTELNSVCLALNESLTIQEAELTRIPQTHIQVETVELGKPLLKLLDLIEAHDDVQRVYANVEMEDRLLAQLEEG